MLLCDRKRTSGQGSHQVNLGGSAHGSFGYASIKMILMKRLARFPACEIFTAMPNG
jgi:hypothetical protein